MVQRFIKSIRTFVRGQREVTKEVAEAAVVSIRASSATHGTPGGAVVEGSYAVYK